MAGSIRKARRIRGADNPRSDSHTGICLDRDARILMEAERSYLQA
jgi:hypothetical protein